MDILGLNFEGMNETDVREEFVSPLLRQLGYRSGSPHHIVRELSLRYPRESLGRKKASDPPLRGKADYICEVHRRIRWVIEAKAPDEQFGQDDVEQAFSYARHPEVRAVYFCLTNGRRFVVYRTDESPDSGPVLEVGYEDFPQAIHRLESLLCPAAVERDFPGTPRELGQPVARGFRSVAQIVSGRVTIRSSSPCLPPLIGVNHSIVAGTIEHAEDGSLIAYIDLLAPYQGLQELNRRFALDRMELRCPATMLSADPSNPSVFQASRSTLIPQGELLFNIATWEYIECPTNCKAQVETKATVFLDINRLHGQWSQRLRYSPGDSCISADGDFEARVF